MGSRGDEGIWGAEDSQVDSEIIGDAVVKHENHAEDTSAEHQIKVTALDRASNGDADKAIGKLDELEVRIK